MRDMALAYLTRDPVGHMEMIHPVQRGTARILYAGEDGVFLRETRGGAHMISMENTAKGIELLNLAADYEIVSLHQKELAEHLAARCAFSRYMECVQAAYTKKERVGLSSPLDIRPLEPGDIDLVHAHYNKNADRPYLQERLERGEILGGFVDGAPCGFIGLHAEGSMGMLEVFPQYRGRGYGAALTAHLMNLCVERGFAPYSQIELDNAVSLHLHRKLGFEFSKEPLYWLF